MVLERESRQHLVCLERALFDHMCHNHAGWQPVRDGTDWRVTLNGRLLPRWSRRTQKS